MTDITPKEAIANLNHIYGMVAPDIQRSLDVAIKALERPQGDLISRSELIKTVEKGEGISWERHGKDDMCVRKKYIDNAPTVELTEEQAIDKLHETGWLVKHDKEMTERLKGEWKELFRGIHVTDYKCSCCGRTVRDDTGYDVSKDYPFCHCGADMRKGGAE